MKVKYLMLIVTLILLTSCNKKLWQYCEKQNYPAFEKCSTECELALPNPGQSKEDAVKKCKRICKVKLKEDQTNCYYSKDMKCVKKCTKKKSKKCRKNKRSCKKNARIKKRGCKKQCKNYRGKKRRRCKKDCNRVFRGEKRQCKSISCKKSSFNDECLIECK